jgi:predicted DNA-binding protein
MATNTKEAKLTISISEDLRRQAKAAAALHGRTLSDIVRELLEEYIEESLDIEYTDRILDRVARGEEPIFSHEEVWGEDDQVSS